MKPITLDEFFANKIECGSTLSLKGTLFTHYVDRESVNSDPDIGIMDLHFLAPDKSRWKDKSQCIFIGLEWLQDELRLLGVMLRAGGPNGGGFCNDCVIEGTICESTENFYRFELKDLRQIEIETKGETKTLRF